MKLPTPLQFMWIPNISRKLDSSIQAKWNMTPDAIEAYGMDNSVSATNGKDKAWTEPFEMLPYENEKDQVSCGYTGLISTGPDSFLIILSDFKYQTQEESIRKAIKVREVIVKPK